MKRITYSERGPFTSVSLPGVNPGVTLARGESQIVSDDQAKEFQAAIEPAIKSGALPGIQKDHFSVETVKEKAAEATPLANTDDVDALKRTNEELQGTVNELRAKVTEQETTITTLQADLAAARDFDKQAAKKPAGK